MPGRARSPPSSRPRPAAALLARCTSGGRAARAARPSPKRPARLPGGEGVAVGGVEVGEDPLPALRFCETLPERREALRIVPADAGAAHPGVDLDVERPSPGGEPGIERRALAEDGTKVMAPRGGDRGDVGEERGEDDDRAGYSGRA